MKYVLSFYLILACNLFMQAIDNKLISKPSHSEFIKRIDKNVNCYKDSNEINLKTSSIKAVSYAISLDDNFILLGFKKGIAQLWHKKNKEANYKLTQIKLNKYNDRINAIAISSNNKYILFGLDDGNVRILNIENPQKPKEIAIVHGPTDCHCPVSALAFSPNNKYILTAFNGGEVRLWDKKDIKNIKLVDIFKNNDTVSLVRFTQDNKQFFSIYQYNFLSLWNIKSKKQKKIFTTGAYSIDISPDGKYFAVGSNRNTEIWQINNMLKPFAVIDKSNYIHEVAFSSDSNLLFSKANNNIKIWDIKSKKFINNFSNFSKKNISKYLAKRMTRTNLPKNYISNVINDYL